MKRLLLALTFGLYAVLPAVAQRRLIDTHGDSTLMPSDSVVVGYQRVRYPVAPRVLHNAQDSAAEKARQHNIRGILHDETIAVRQRREAAERAALRARTALSPAEKARRAALAAKATRRALAKDAVRRVTAQKRAVRAEKSRQKQFARLARSKD